MAATVAVPSDPEALRPSLVEIWEKTWVKCEEMGTVVALRHSRKSLWSVFVDVFKCVRSISRTSDGAEWPLQRVSTLMTIPKGE
jgi:hypothetical protein